MACGVGGKAKFDGDASVGGLHINGDDKIDTFGDDGLDYNRFDAGWNIGLGVELSLIHISAFCNGRFSFTQAMSSEKI